jgi:hypothetical protein
MASSSRTSALPTISTGFFDFSRFFGYWNAASADLNAIRGHVSVLNRRNDCSNVVLN